MAFEFLKCDALKAKFLFQLTGDKVPSHWTTQKWSLAILLLYGLAFCAFTIPLLFSLFIDDDLRSASKNVARGIVNPEIFLTTEYLFVLGIFLLLQALLLLLPAQMAMKRTVARRHIFYHGLACSSMFAFLAAGVFGSLQELIFALETAPDYEPYIVISGIIISWLVWCLFFMRQPWRKDPMGALNCISKWLIAGSALELLVAVPCHIIARYRNYCCAGLLTGTAIAAGLSVALLAFGPALFFLFYQRWQAKYYKTNLERKSSLTDAQRPEPDENV